MNETSSLRHNTESFYARIKGFDDFSEIANLDNFEPAPEDWYVVVADIRRSTQAIEEGRYKDVNMVGAATITAVLNVTKAYDIPYVFGGDGATMMIPPEALPLVREALLKTRHFAKSQFDLELLIGAVPVHRVRNRTTDVLVSKFQLSPGNFLAVFSGGGVRLVETMIRKDDGTKGYLIDDATTDGDLNLEGLSCRWEPLVAQRGVMLSMLIHARSDEREAASKIYGAVMKEVSDVLGGEPAKNQPVKASNLKFRWPPKNMKLEVASTTGCVSYIKRLLYLYGECLVQGILEKFSLRIRSYDAAVYRKELEDNTDYRRFDDTLRMVLDCSVDEVEKIERVLSDFKDRNEIVYGTHQADSALMTCLVFNLTEGEHVHFIDGSDGGFAVAAKQMKAQMNA